MFGSSLSLSPQSHQGNSHIGRKCFSTWRLRSNGCEVRAAEFMKNKGAHWRNSCSGFFCGIDNAVDPETVVALDDPRIQKALEKRNQGGVQPTNYADRKSVV